MKLVDDWKVILRKAWSMRFIAMTAALGGLEMALPLFSDAVPRNIFLGLSIVTSVAAAIFRLLYQPKMHEDAP